MTLGRKVPSLESRRSGCSVSIGEGITGIKAGLATGLQLVVDDVEAARDELSGRGLEVSEVHDFPWGRFVFFTDPDGNGWAVQQIPDYGAGIAGAGQLVLPSQQLLGGGLPLLRRHDRAAQPRRGRRWRRARVRAAIALTANAVERAELERRLGAPREWNLPSLSKSPSCCDVLSRPPIRAATLHLTGTRWEADAMTEHRIVSREDWQTAREELLAREKEHTRMGDELAGQRRELPWVRVEKEYRFDTDEGTRTLAELFDGRSQLLVYHFMFGPSYEAGCPACTSMGDTINGVLPHLHARDVTMLLVSRAPLERLQAYKRRMGWSIPWASTAGNDFNLDMGVSSTPEQVREQMGPALDDWPGLRETAAATGTGVAEYVAESPTPTATAFVLDDGVVYQTYSTQGRGVEFLMGYYPILDRAPKGRDEGDLRAPASLLSFRRHDEY